MAMSVDEKRERDKLRKRLRYAEQKEHCKAIVRKSMLKHADEKKVQYRERRQNSQLNWRVAGVRARAKRQGRECTITTEDLTMVTHCPILGIELDWTNTKQSDNSPSIDRIDNRLGYVAGNVHIISWRANNLKSNGTIIEFEHLLSWLKINNGCT